MRNIVAIGLVALIGLAAKAQVPPIDKAPPPGIERGRWSVEGWGNAGKTEVLADGKRRVLKATYFGGDKDKTSFKTSPLFVPPKDGKIRLHIYAPDDRAPRIAVALTTGSDFKWHESVMINLRRGWNAVAVPMAAPYWKTVSSGWQYKVGIDRPDEVRSVSLLAYNGRGDGWLFVEGFVPGVAARGPRQRPGPRPQGKTPTTPTDARFDEMAKLGQGFVVWQSNRTGNWRIWTRQLDGEGLRQLSDEDKRQDHVAPIISPDGKAVAYLSHRRGQSVYGEPVSTQGVALHLVQVADGKDRILVDNARSYGEQRACVWLDGKTIIYIDALGTTQELDLGTGQSTALTSEPQPEHGWLIDATKRFAARGLPPSFSPYDAETKRIFLHDEQMGAQAYFTHDGAWGFWTAGAGGPIKAVHLASGRVTPVLQRHDKRLPETRGYVGFPMISPCGRLFAFAASPDQHDLQRSDYDIFLAQLDEHTLSIKGKPIAYSSHKRGDIFPSVFLAIPELGRHRGEAPLTVTFDVAGKEGKWQWDFGEGVARGSSIVSYLYEDPGQYLVSATQDEDTRQGWVTVEKRGPPRLLAARVRGGDIIELCFDEKILVVELKAKLASEAKIAKWQLGPDEQSLLLTVEGRLRRRDTLIIEGVGDQAKSTNFTKPLTVPLRAPLWPTDRNGLALAWRTREQPNLVHDEPDKPGRTFHLAPRGLARYNHHFAMQTARGAFVAEDAGADLLAKCTETSELTIEAVILPASLNSDRLGYIISLSTGAGSRNFTLAQKRDALLLGLRTSDTGDAGNEPMLPLARLSTTAPNHVVIAYKPGFLHCVVNGETVKTTDELTGDLSTWTQQELVFGDDWAGGNDWAGVLEGVGVYSRFLEKTEAQKNYRAYTRVLTTRKPVDTIVVEAQLSALSTPLTAKQIAPYPAALAVHEYRVTKVLAGQLPDKVIRVAHWAVMDREALPSRASSQGKLVRLTLERLEDNPQLRAVVVANTLPVRGVLPPVFFAPDP